MAVSPADRSFKARRSAPMKRIRTGGSKRVKERPSREDRGSFDSPPFPLWTHGQCPPPQLPPEMTCLVRSRSPTRLRLEARSSGCSCYVVLLAQRSFKLGGSPAQKRVRASGSMRQPALPADSRCLRAPSAEVSRQADPCRRNVFCPAAACGSGHRPPAAAV